MWPFDRRRKFIQSLGQEQAYTPDMTAVEDSEYKLVFIHDDLLPGHTGQDKIKDHGRSQVVSRGFTTQPFDYRVSKHNGKAVPFYVKPTEGLKVKGKICAVRNPVIPVLDNHYRNGVEFARIRINIIVVDKDHKLMSIGNEEFLRNLPPGMIRTVPELGLRHYTSNSHVGLVGCYMYVALRRHWDIEDLALLPRERPTFPKTELTWLPKYYRYPDERNRCHQK